jgi:hypothetical protein
MINDKTRSGRPSSTGFPSVIRRPSSGVPAKRSSIGLLATRYFPYPFRTLKFTIDYFETWVYQGVANYNLD